MGQFKKTSTEQMEEKASTKELMDFLQELLSRKELQDAHEGIAKKIIAEKGISSLSQKQKDIIFCFIESYKKAHKCKNALCEGGLKLVEYIEIADSENGYCTMCQYEEERLNRE
jgi:hypothetical protein